MHVLSRASLKNRALIVLMTVVAAVFGVLGMGQLKQELMPAVDFPVVAVSATYPGATPEVVNADVTIPIETALRGVPGLKTTSGTSSTDSSMVIAEFAYGVDLTITEQRVERALSRLNAQLPDSAEWRVFSGGFDDFPVIQIAVSPGEGGDPEAAAERVQQVLIPELEEIDGVREASLSGARGERVLVALDPKRLEDAGLTASQVQNAIQQSGRLMPAGSITDNGETLSVQTGTRLTSVEDIASIPIPVTPQLPASVGAQVEGGERTAAGAAGPFAADTGVEAGPVDPPVPITVDEVADVAIEANPETSISRVNGKPAVTLAVTKVSNANTVEVSHAVQQVLDDSAPSLDGATLTVIFDQAPYIEDSIETLSTEGLLGLVFAVLVILIFLFSLRSTLVTAISIPTSILVSLVGLWLTGNTLNMLTLGALTISIGRVVDDSIVVMENIQRHLTPGVDRTEAIVRAVKEVAGAITSSTVATIVVFLPIAFVGDMVGELFRPFALTVSIALAASLLVSLTIVPVLASWFLRPAASRASETVTAGVADMRHPTRLQRSYLPVITWTVRRPVTTLVLAFLVLVGTFASAPLMKTNFIGGDGQNNIGVTQTLPPSTSLDEQLAAAVEAEAALAKVTAVDTVQVTIGSNDLVAFGAAGGSGIISYSLTTDEHAPQAEVQQQIRDALSGLDGEFSVGVGRGGGAALSSNIEIAVAAPDQAALRTANDALVEALREREEFSEVETNLASELPIIAVSVDRQKAAEQGLSEAAVAGMISEQMQPSRIGSVEIDDRSLSLFMSRGTSVDTVDQLRAMPLALGTESVRVDALANVESQSSPVSVTTVDGVRQATLTVVPQEDDLTTAALVVQDVLSQVTLDGGAEATVGGVLAEQEAAFEQLGLALLAAILIVYVVMVATFRSLLQPLLLLVSVPFAATGAILLLIATGIPLGVPSLIGVLMLIGIVVTNAIVLVDLINQYRDRGATLEDAVIAGSANRYRPIVMTALATILALMPMGLGITGEGGFISQPLAVVVIGGLLSSTVLTLVVLPTLYFQVERRRDLRRQRRIERQTARHDRGRAETEPDPVTDPNREEPRV